jgi:dihydropteroate synthase-like protein
MSPPRILFVTGRLAEPTLRGVLADATRSGGFDYGFEYEVAVLPISVAALMHVDWVQRKLHVPAGITRVVLPGWCQGDLEPLAEQCGVPFVRGPKDLYDIPAFFGTGVRPPPSLDRYDIEILAEINHAPRLTPDQLHAAALDLRRDGADVIDLGCIPGKSWSEIGPAVSRLKEAGLRVSIDSFERREVTAAVAAGAELVLSCNASNRDWAADLGVELVVIPDDPRDLAGLDATVEFLARRGVPFRLDPVLEPIGFGFAASLERYAEVRRRYPDAPMMIGVGNLTELTEVDSAGVNMLLAALCQEWRIHSVLTTQVIPWCRFAVAEFDRARRIVRHAVENKTLPKHLSSGMVQLRGERVRESSAEDLSRLAETIKDPNFRLFVSDGMLHALNRDGHRSGTDPYELFDRLGVTDASHAFYLGYELAKAMTALTLGKQYTQDEALDWGWQTRPEISALHRRKESNEP